MTSSQKSAAPAGDEPAAEIPEKEDCVACRCPLQILDGLTDACIVSDVTGRLRYANEAARELLHLRGRVTGRKLQAVLADRHALQIVEESIKANRPRSMVMSLTFSSNGARSYDVSVMPVQAAGEEMLLRIALRPAESGESDRDPAKGDLNPDTVQRLGDPLTIIQGYLENLLDGAIRDPVVMRQCLAAMQRQAVQIQRILGSLRN